MIYISRVPGLGLGLKKFLWPRPHSLWPRPHVKLASLTSLTTVYDRFIVFLHAHNIKHAMMHAGV